MLYKNCLLFFHIELILYWVCLTIGPCLCFEFDRNYIGVSFLGGGVQEKIPYTSDNVETMLTLVSQKFSKILVKDKFNFHGEYIASLYAGEVAAKLNKKNNNSTVTVMFQVREFDTVEKSNTEIYIAFETVERLNKIYPGTVEGICFGRGKDMQQILNHFVSFRSRANVLGIKLGVDLDCSVFLSKNNDTLEKTLHQLVNATDFIFCWGKYYRLSIGPVNAWEHVSRSLLAYQYAIKSLNPNVEVIANCLWSSSGIEEWETVENLKIYWETASDWAFKNQYRVYMFEAFDNPKRKPHNDKHLGWWKVTGYSENGLIDGYVEKISGMNVSASTWKPELPSSSTPMPTENGTEKSYWNNTSTILAVIGGISSAVLLVVVGVLLFSRKKKAPEEQKLREQDVRDFILGAEKEHTAVLKGRASAVENAMSVPYDTTLEIGEDNLKIDQNILLGSGQFGFVFKGVIQVDGEENIQVAVKVAKENCRAVGLKGLLSEIKIMSYLGKHTNIVELKGAYTAELIHGRLYVLTEFCNFGSLEYFLRNKMSSTKDSTGDGENDNSDMEVEKEKNEDDMELQSYVNVAFQDMLRWSCEIACGMEYLEKKHVVHADLATRNVLLSAEKTAKISDFGLSRRMYNYTNYVKTQQEPLPWRWMAIESLKKMEFSSKSDVWSYGVTLWEIFSKGDTPYSGITWTQSFVGRLESGLRPNCPKFASPEIYNIMRDCWNPEPKERPHFREFVEIIENLLR